MCFSHANRLPFRLTCLTGGVQWCCLCQRDVFDSLLGRVMFPSTSFWCKSWRFGALIAFSASSVLFQMLPFAYWTYISMAFFWSNKIASCTFVDFRANLKSWRCGSSIPVPLECKSSALPSEFYPRGGNVELMTPEAFFLLMQWLNGVFYCLSF